jgi:hypothetical protein
MSISSLPSFHPSGQTDVHTYRHRVHAQPVQRLVIVKWRIHRLQYATCRSALRARSPATVWRDRSARVDSVRRQQCRARQRRRRHSHPQLLQVRCLRSLNHKHTCSTRQLPVECHDHAVFGDVWCGHFHAHMHGAMRVCTSIPKHTTLAFISSTKFIVIKCTPTGIRCSIGLKCDAMS